VACDSCAEAHKKWLEWWKENRDRYPAARREVPASEAAKF
jgi:hypothetical protein